MNKFLIDDKYPIPHLNEIFSTLTGGSLFCKLDIKNAYLHLESDEESSLLQTLSTHLRSFKVKRLFFGIKTEPSIWQRYIDSLLDNIEGVSVFFDDIKIQATSAEQLLARLEMVLKILQENNICLNKEKCSFFETSLKYLGYKIDKFGIHKTKDPCNRRVNKHIQLCVCVFFIFVGLPAMISSAGYNRNCVIFFETIFDV